MADVANFMEPVQEAFTKAFTPVQDQAIQLTPKVLAMVVILVAGYAVSRLVSRLIVALTERVGLQIAAERSGLAESMQHMGIKRNVPAILGTIVFWLLMCVSIMAAFNVLGLDKLSGAMDKLVVFIPNLLIATVVIVIGLLVASFLRGVVATSADRVGLSYAQHLGSGCYYVLALLTFMAAFNQMGFHFDLFNYLILIVVGGVALGFGLSFGLGGRDVMAGILAGYYLRQRIAAGDHVQLGAMEGIVREVGPVATIIETTEAGLVNRHSVPNTKMLNEAVR